ncbi:kinesin motor protein cin8 [Scheffersomyces spartinae]|uniref:Kinesin motor protein cin8 n=1 Tax=Scheffersomyces spartinae TaxID=45513 RepID=A0A9P8AIY7_9ASCO|nr:kinesin motor protein cin8 [Scheffersomyces spartinae]KAG7193621.1 kinesin motor protein cin8 [Scheffersomyces spartinae]
MGHIRVAVRCRGRTTREKKECSPVVVEMADGDYNNNAGNTTTNEAYVTMNTNSIGHGKTYIVDQTFGPEADQQTIFENVAVPMFEDFYRRNINATIFAYGQTGTGKTYTMCGPAGSVPEQQSESGIIPRLIRLLFENLKTSPPKDHSVTVSYLEIYNEMLTDLLLDENVPSTTNMKRSATQMPLRIVEDKQSRSIRVVNLTEKVVVDSEGAIQSLLQGLRRRKTASTKLNDHSSRSHTIFTMVLQRKDPNSDYFITNKLNLVDLAGSENINKSGVDSARAKEAGNINQSLLALGRVINSLASANGSDNINPVPIISASASSHIPYRESKLTRILQDSLGGHTLTALIATISPALANSNETSLTLDYASRAKNIQNLPQSTSESDIVLKTYLVRELCDTISRLEADLRATRRKNGIFLDEANFESMKKEIQELKIQLKEASTERSRLLLKHQREMNTLTNEREKLNSQAQVLRSELDISSKEIAQLKAQINLIKQERNADKMLIQDIKKDLELARSSYKKELESSSHLAHKAIDSLIKAVVSESEQKSDMERSMINTLTTFKNVSLKEIDRAQENNHKILELVLLRMNTRLSGEVDNATTNIKNQGSTFHTYIQKQFLQQPPSMDNKEIIERLLENVQEQIIENLNQFKSEIYASNENIQSQMKAYHEQEREEVSHRVDTFTKSSTSEVVSIKKQAQKSILLPHEAFNEFDDSMNSLRQETSKLGWNSKANEENSTTIISDSQIALKALRKHINNEEDVIQSPSKSKIITSPLKLPPPKTPQQQSSSSPKHNLLKRSLIPQLSKGSGKKRKVLQEVENF